MISDKNSRNPLTGSGCGITGMNNVSFIILHFWEQSDTAESSPYRHTQIHPD